MEVAFVHVSRYVRVYRVKLLYKIILKRYASHAAWPACSCFPDMSVYREKVLYKIILKYFGIRVKLLYKIILKRYASHSVCPACSCFPDMSEFIGKNFCTKLF